MLEWLSTLEWLADPEKWMLVDNLMRVIEFFLVVAGASALVLGVFAYFQDRKKDKWSALQWALTIVSPEDISRIADSLRTVVDMAKVDDIQLTDLLSHCSDVYRDLMALNDSLSVLLEAVFDRYLNNRAYWYICGYDLMQLVGVLGYVSKLSVLQDLKLKDQTDKIPAAFLLGDALRMLKQRISMLKGRPRMTWSEAEEVQPVIEIDLG